MLSTLIPFGLRANDHQLVDVSTVPRGKQCGCICPSCHTSLIARQGENRAWHFAHVSQGVYEETDQECTFSFYVSVRLMAKQLIGARCRLKLPEYREHVFGNVKAGQGQRSIAYTITREQVIEIEAVEVEKSFEGVRIDVFGKVKDFPFGIYFTHPGRKQPVEPERFQEMSIGIVAIDLTDLKVQFAQARSRGNTYASVLKHFLASDTQSKHWIYHPRRRKRQAAAEAHLAALMETEILPSQMLREDQPSSQYALPGLPESPPLQLQSQRVQYECMICNIEWEGIEPGLNPCPKCGSHLFRRVKEKIQG